jgi:hypothetical protein
MTIGVRRIINRIESEKFCRLTVIRNKTKFNDSKNREQCSCDGVFG